VRHGDHGSRHVVVAGEDGCRPRLLRQQAACRSQARAVGEQALRHALRRYRQAGFLHGVHEGLVAQLGRGVLRVPLDESNVLVAQRQQVARHGARAFVVVDAHRCHAGQRARSGHCHCRDADFIELAQRLFGVAQGRRHQDAVGAFGDQPFDGLALAGQAVAAFQQQLGAILAALVHRADQQGAQESGAGIAVQQANAQRTDAGCACRMVHLVFERRDGGQHLVARGLADMGIAVDDARDRHGRHPGRACHVIYGGAASGARLFAYIVHFVHACCNPDDYRIERRTM